MALVSILFTACPFKRYGAHPLLSLKHMHHNRWHISS